MTDAHGASGAVWPRPLRRSPQSKPRLRENGETTSGAVDRRLVSQSEQPGKRGISPAGSRHAQRQNEFESGMRGTPQTRLLRERQTESGSVSVCPEAGSFPQERCDFGEFSVNKPLYSSGART